MNVVAIDLATVTGWAQLLDGRLASGFLRLGPVGSEHLMARLRAAEDWFPRVLAPIAWGQGHLAYERPLTTGRNRAATRTALHFEAALLLAASSLGVDHVRDYQGSTVKKHATGNGRAGKDHVIAAMRRRWNLPELADDNEADALAVLSLHLERSA